MNKYITPSTPAMRERADYHRVVCAEIARTHTPLSDTAALIADVFTHTPQEVMQLPLAEHARTYVNTHADMLWLRSLTRAEMVDALDELANRGLIPEWCEYVPSEGVTR